MLLVWSRQRITTTLTVVAVCVWVLSLIARTILPSTAPTGAGIDTIMLLVCSYWFATKTGGSGS